MNDITALTQREKFEAWLEEAEALPWGYLKKRRTSDDTYHEPNTTDMWGAWQAGSVEMVEAQHDAAVNWEAAASMNVENQELKQRIAELESRTVTAAASDVLAERQRQISMEGWTPEGDDHYTYAELSIAAQCYAAHHGVMGSGVPVQWPWDDEWWKPSDRRRNLIKAGALIIAEIERLDRAAGIRVIEGEGQ